MSPRNLVLAAGIVLISADLFQTVARRLRSRASQADGQPVGPEDEAHAAGGAARTAAANDEAAQASRPTSDGPPIDSIDGQPGSAQELLEAFKQNERPDAGFRADPEADADHVRPGIADFARGA